MTAIIQLLSLLISLGYGIGLFWLTKIHFYYFRKWILAFRIIAHIIYINFISLGYVAILFWVNGGVWHIYFILLVVLGYGLGYVKRCKDGD